MVVAESDMLSQAEVDSSAMPPSDHQNSKTNHKDHNNPGNGGNDNGNHNNVNTGSYAFPNLGRQSSIYSLTLDEFQHALCESGKNFGSMNMDEFLNSIWTAEENQAHHGHHHDNVNSSSLAQLPSTNAKVSSMSKGITKQPSLPRQGSLTLPAPLCQKTVDEVWSEIQRTQQQQQPPSQQQQRQVANSESTQRQPTFGEMTLEDFLIKAGVVREQFGPIASPPVGPVAPPPQHQQQHQQYGFANPHSQMGPPFVARPMMGMGAGGPPYPAMPPSAGETSGYTANGKRNNGYPTPVVGPSVACYGGRVNNGVAPGCGFGAGLTPVSPVSPDGICGPGQMDNSAGHYGLDMAALRGRKRVIDGPVEKVVERRQRRMIKNRESAARSRARKQAYTVELEAELNQLREENAQLKLTLEEIERQRKQQYLEEQKLVALTRAQRAQEKLKAMKRSRSCTL